jgi:hypothetical protein
MSHVKPEHMLHVWWTIEPAIMASSATRIAHEEEAGNANNVSISD